MKTVRGVVAEPSKCIADPRSVAENLAYPRRRILRLRLRGRVRDTRGTRIHRELRGRRRHRDDDRAGSAAFVFRFAVQSFVNGFIAFAWPVFVLDYLGGWGFLALGAGWLAFEYLAKPLINARLPELAPEKKPSQAGTS